MRPAEPQAGGNVEGYVDIVEDTAEELLAWPARKHWDVREGVNALVSVDGEGSVDEEASDGVDVVYVKVL